MYLFLLGVFISPSPRSSTVVSQIFSPVSHSKFVVSKILLHGFKRYIIKSRRSRWARHVARMGEGRGVHRVLVWKPEGKRPLEKPRRRWEDNIKMDLQEVVGSCGDWMELLRLGTGGGHL
jgi:hypothetical protein